MRVRDLVESGSLAATIRIDSPMLHHISFGHRSEAVINDSRA